MFLPESSHPVLESHEEGHVDICQAVFGRAVSDAIEKGLPEVRNRFTVEDLDRCRTETMRRLAQAEINAMCGRFAEKVQRHMMRQLQEASTGYDRMTNNGRRDPGGGPSVRGQRDAARAAIRTSLPKDG